MAENVLKNQNFFKSNINLVKSSISNTISQNRLLFFLYTVSLVGGIAAGCITYFITDAERANKIFSYMQNYFMGSVLVGISFPEVFKSILIDNLKLVIVFFISGISVFLCPLAFIRVFSKGFSIGMTTVFFLSRYAIKGIVFSTLSIFLCNAIIVPAIIVYAVYSTSESIKMFRFRKKRKLGHSLSQNQNLPRFMLRCIISAIILFIILIIAALIQGFVSPGMMRIFYTLISQNA